MILGLHKETVGTRESNRGPTGESEYGSRQGRGRAGRGGEKRTQRSVRVEAMR